MSRIPHRGQGHVYVQMELACGHQGSSEAANDGVTPVRTGAWCVTCQAMVARAALAEAEAYARVTGAVAVTVRHERRMADGSLVVEAEATYPQSNPGGR